MRNAFADEITKIGQENPRLLLLAGDIGNKLFDRFKAAQHDRFFNCGIAEANMISVAAGLALNGFRPVCYTITPFITARCLEQIRVDICYHEAPVIFVGVGAGLSYANNGATHHSCEDIAMLRGLPGLVILCPADPSEVRSALRAAVASHKPVYLRLGKKGEPQILEHNNPFTIGKAQNIVIGDEVAILSCGTMLPTALEVSKLLAVQGKQFSVWNFPTVKPMDQRALEQICRGHALIVTLEEHSHLGGFGSAVLENLADLGLTQTRLLRLGTSDRFLHEGGEQEHARKLYGLDIQSVAARITEAQNRIRRDLTLEGLVEQSVSHQS